MSSGLNTEQMLLKDMKAVSGSLNLAISVLYITLEVSWYALYIMYYKVLHFATMYYIVLHTVQMYLL